MANGDPIRNLGEKCVPFVDENGQAAESVFQVAEVTRPLESVTETCDEGCRVVLGSGGGFIYHLRTGTYTPIHRRGRLYEVDRWIKVPDNGQLAANSTSSF